MGVLNDYANAAAVNAALNKGVEANKAVSELKEDLVNIKNRTIDKLKIVKSIISKPNDFVWTSNMPITIRRNIDGEISTDIETLDYKFGGKTYYVAMNGNDSRDGLTPETAFRSVYKARSMDDVRTIIVSDGWYDVKYAFDSNSTGVSGYKDLDIIGIGNVYLTTTYTVSWSKTESYTNLYQTTRALTCDIYDTTTLDEFGDYTKYTKVSDLTVCNNTEGSWFIDTSNVVYVHTIGNKIPNNDFIKVFLMVGNFKSIGDKNLYFENIKFYGGGKENGTYGGCVEVEIGTDSNAKIVCKDCEFKYNYRGAGAFISRGYDSVLIGCSVSNTYLDGFNYHYLSGKKIAHAIEINCNGHNCGDINGESSDQISTIHDGSKIIRINCDYSHSVGCPIHDVNTNTQSWNLGVLCSNSLSTRENSKANFGVSTGAEMWLDTCGGYGSPKAYFSDSKSSIHKHNCIFDTDIVYATGTIDEY